MFRVDVCIPTYRPGEEFKKLISRLSRQSVAISSVRICNTDIDGWSAEYDLLLDSLKIPYSLVHIKPAEFDHGRVRDELIRSSEADYVLCMTQDAYPYDDKLIENMLKGFSNPGVAAVYARQLPKADSTETEKLSRIFNYGKKDCLKTAEDLGSLGIKTFFCSNVCAMYDRGVYLSGKGFPEKTIFNEDMIHARELIDRGYGIYYAAFAKVFHSHRYSLMKQFHRNFDLAYSQSVFPEVFSGISSESEGIRYVRFVLGRLFREGKFSSMIRFVLECSAKYAGFFLGKRAEKLPRKIRIWCSDNREYFKSI